MLCAPAIADEPANTPAPPTVARPSALSGLEKLVDDTVTPSIERGEVAGAVVTVVKDGHVLLLKGYGFADIARQMRVDPQTTLFRIGSISKTFTWTALTQLIAEGKIGLDQPIDQLLPEALRPEPDRYGSQPILVRHLLTHTAGFEDRIVNHFFLRDPGQVQPLHEALQRYKPKRIRPPGVSASYSNYGAALAGAIVQNVSGESYEDYLDRHILWPLQMTRTTAREPLGTHDSRSMPQTLSGDVAQGYIFTGHKLEARPFEHLSHVGPAGSISSTAADMDKYMLAHLQPGTILDPASEARMQSRLFGNAPESPGLGYGWLLGRVGKLRTVWHDGGTMAFHSTLILVPEERLGIFISTNSSTGAQVVEAIPTKILTTYFPAARAVPTPVRVSPDVLEGYSGTYLGDRLSTTTAERFFAGLIAETRKVKNDRGSLVINGSRLVPVDDDVFVTDGEVLSFQRNNRGHVTGFTSTVESFHRLSPWRTPLAAVVLAGLVALLSLVNLIAGRRILQPHSHTSQRLALALNLGASCGWLVFVGCMVASFVRMIQSPLDIVFTYPSTALVIGLWAGVCAAVLSVSATISSAIALPSSNWPRRMQFVISAILWAALMLSLSDWRLLGLSA